MLIAYSQCYEEIAAVNTTSSFNKLTRNPLSRHIAMAIFLMLFY